MNKKSILFGIKAIIAYIIMAIILMFVFSFIVFPIVLGGNQWLATILSSIILFIALFISLYFSIKNSKDDKEILKNGIVITIVCLIIFIIYGAITDRTKSIELNIFNVILLTTSCIINYFIAMRHITKK